MSAFSPNKDSSGKTLTTHGESIPRGWISPTSGPSSNNVKSTPKLNRADRRKLAKLLKRTTK